LVLSMPIYEYESVEPGKGCEKCATRFEVIQKIHEAPLTDCPNCGRKVKKVISKCRAAIIETHDEYIRTERKISEYEKKGMWSHAAELADKHSEKFKDREAKTRALENYKKAGYDLNLLEKHDNTDN
jgi:putative FmdB family regulatory protein